MIMGGVKEKLSAGEASARAIPRAGENPATAQPIRALRSVLAGCCAHRNSVMLFKGSRICIDCGAIGVEDSKHS